MVAVVDTNGEIIAVIAQPANEIGQLAHDLGIEIPLMPQGVSTMSVLVDASVFSELSTGDATGFTTILPASPAAASARADRPSSAAAAIRRGAWKVDSAVEPSAGRGPIVLTERDLTPLPLNAPEPSPAPSASSGSAGTFSPSGGGAGGFAALSALLGIAAAIMVSRRLRLSPAVWRPVAFHSPLERPG
jgi:hypothetical protein